ncbi:hypothetical protein QBC34DRAFT_408467 [Podospora aff. communis PSN243]|uniref:DNA/RNA-binding protein Alba-like domain-containing protein n=1 Tax=Podospora aff. communis PSN243 TaxID=3040156 RepID=A0AAV9GIY9_9PEZI|nr:hypothetical protein QBC34DRAFT_408467 [Podospora aff. communis PSN243]
MQVHAQRNPKRKHPSDGDTPMQKKQRITMVSNPSSTTSHYFAAHELILAQIRPRFEVKTMSVMPSTSIKKHVDKALDHLGRFSAWDTSVLPGVVFFSGSLKASNKLITIGELVRRRIEESDQKWYQYNILNETECEEESVVEETFLAMDDDAGHESNDDEYFETLNPTIHELAVTPGKILRKSYMGTLFSRVPLDEIKNHPNISTQTNEASIDLLRKRKMGGRG